jgi:hypothetical protein
MRPGVMLRISTFTVSGLLLAGCSLFSGGGAGTDDQQTPKVEIGPDNHVKGAIAKAVQPNSGKDVYVDILSLRRHDNVLRLVYAVTPRARGNSDELTRESFGGTFGTPDAGGPYLLDLEGMHEYEHLTIGQGDKQSCACSVVQVDFALDQPTVLYVDYPALPDSVTDVTVVVPIVGPMPGVKIS